MGNTAGLLLGALIAGESFGMEAGARLGIDATGTAWSSGKASAVLGAGAACSDTFITLRLGDGEDCKDMPDQ
ncbi:MAG: hypothetical protein ACXU7H_03925 [Burkholderiaceae bacterium]